MSYRALDWANALQLPKREGAVLRCLAHHHNGKTGLCCPGIDLIAQETGYSVRSVKYALNDLRLSGLVNSVARRRKGAPISNSYTLQMQSATVAPTSQVKCNDCTHQSATIAHKQGSKEQGSKPEQGSQSASSYALALEPAAGALDNSDQGKANPENLGEGKEEKMANAKEIVDKFKQKGMAAKGNAALVILWKKYLAETTGDFQPSMTTKETSQLKQFAVKVGEDKAQALVEFALKRWAEFGTRAKTDAGLLTYPSQPNTGFLLVHANTLVALYVTKTTPKPKAALKVFDKPSATIHSETKADVHPDDAPMTEDEKAAAYEKAMAALNAK